MAPLNVKKGAELLSCSEIAMFLRFTAIWGHLLSRSWKSETLEMKNLKNSKLLDFYSLLGEHNLMAYLNLVLADIRKNYVICPVPSGKWQGSFQGQQKWLIQQRVAGLFLVCFKGYWEHNISLFYYFSYKSERGIG